MDLKKLAYNTFWGVWPEKIQPAAEPDQFTMRVWGNKSTLLWPQYVNWRARKEARKFAVKSGFRDAQILNCDRNRLLQQYDYTILLLR